MPNRKPVVMDRTRSRQVVRVIAMFRLMQEGYCSTGWLAQRLGVSERTARRDFAAISHGRVRLKHDGSKRWWMLQSQDKTGRWR